MSSAASLLQDQGTDGTHALAGRLTPDLLRRRFGQRRQMLAVQAASYALGALVRVTISAGIATLRPDENPDTPLARADNALYAAKQRGRIRIASA